ncbi:amino acid transporter, putative [Plasmodium gallinaceum]|uniref:Amino acid transporter, putative n=1 Tax=Plasmodium gallinaceum TaxID=5849 RepID=A0A1J1H369_PLAGA|nr:amino acid transporter, putative [Plasmodium gallinaceum]CRG97933.1 amino acid transporter, putative [Plasmodium gallinaceum]
MDINKLRNEFFHEYQDSDIKNKNFFYKNKNKNDCGNCKKKNIYWIDSQNYLETTNNNLSLTNPRNDKHMIKRKKKFNSFRNTYDHIINFIKENKNDMKKIRYSLFLKAYEKSELCQIKKQNKREKMNLNKYNKYIDIKDAKEKQRLKLLKLLKSYHIKYEGYTSLDTLCDYSIYFQDKSVKDTLLKKQNCDNFLYYLVTIGISYNDIIKMASVFENMEYLKNCNLYMLPWIYKKLNEFHNFDVKTFVLHCVAYSVATLNSSLYLFIRYKTIAIIFPLFITYTLLSAPFLLQEINCGRLVLDGCISFFWSINYYHLPIAMILIISYFISIIKYIDLICLQIYYFSYYFKDNNPWIYKNIDTKICSKFNGSKNICNFSRNICYYNESTNTCEINNIKLGTKIYDMLLNNYDKTKSQTFTMAIVLFSFFSLILYNFLSKYKTSHKIVKIFLSFLILLFVIHIFSIRDFTFIRFLFNDFNFSKIISILSNHEVWILCMIHCTTNLSLHSGVYFYSSKGLRLGVNVISSTYFIILFCFFLDILIFVTFANIIAKHIKNIDKNYYFLIELMKKNAFFILIPVANNYCRKFTLFLSIYVAVIFLTLILLAASKRVDILFLSIKDIYNSKGSKMFIAIWILLFLFYYIYRVADSNFRVIFVSYLSQIFTLLILLCVNFNFFWLSGLKETAQKLGKWYLVFTVLLTFINEFFLIYCEIHLKLANRVFLYFLRQFINIFIIPFISIIICQKILRLKDNGYYNKSDMKTIMRSTFSLALGCTDKSAKIQLQFIPRSKYTTYFNIFLVLYLKYFGIDLVFMCFLYVANNFFVENEVFFKKKYSNAGINEFIVLLLYIIFLYVVYINIPLFQWIKKKRFLKTNNFNVLDFPVLFEEKKKEKKNALFTEFIDK